MNRQLVIAIVIWLGLLALPFALRPKTAAAEGFS